MKYFFWAALGAAAALSLGAALLRSVAIQEVLNSYIVKASLNVTGKPLRFERIPHLSLFPPGIRFEAVSWGMDEDGKPAAEGLSAAAKGGEAHVALLPLLRGKLAAREVRLDSPQVFLRLQGDERAGATVPPQDAGKTPAGLEAPAISFPDLDRLSVGNGSLRLDMGQGRVTRVEAFNASVTDLRPGGAGVIKLDMGIECEKPALAGNLALSAQVRLENGRIFLRQTRLAFTPLRGPLPAAAGPAQASLEGTYALADGEADLSSLKLSMNGLAAEISGRGRLAEGKFTGILRCSAQPRVLGKSFGLGVPPVPGGVIRLESAVNAGGNHVRLDNITGTLDGAELSGALDLGLAPLSLRGRLLLGEINLDAAAEAAASAPAPAGGTAGAQSPPSAAARKTAFYPAVDLDVRAASLTVRKLTLRQAHAHVRGAGGEDSRYTADPVGWDFAAGGVFRGMAAADLSAMRYRSSGVARDVAVGPLWQALQGKRPVDGVATVEYSLVCAGTDAAALKSSLSGKGSLTMRDILLNGVSLPPAGTSLKGEALARFSRLRAPFAIRDGVVKFDGATAAGDGVSARGGGVIRLPEQTLNMTGTISLSGLHVPVYAAGTFSNPSYGVDPKGVVRGLARGSRFLLEEGKAGLRKGAGAVESIIKGLLER